MSPRGRGGGGGGIGGGSSDDGGGGDESTPTYYDLAYYEAATRAEASVLRALLAFASILLVVAVAGIVTTIWRSWRNSHDKRNKTRFALFTSCLVMVIVGRTILIIDLADLLQYPDNYSWFREHDLSSLRPDLFRFFSWAADILLFSLILVIKLKLNPMPKVTVRWNIALFVIVAAMGLAAAIISILLTLTRRTSSGLDFFGYYKRVEQLRLGTTITTIAYAILAFILALAIWMLKVDFSAADVSKINRRCTSFFTMALLLGQALLVPGPLILHFVDAPYYRMVVPPALGTAAEAVWVVKVILMGTIAWDSYILGNVGKVQS